MLRRTKERLTERHIGDELHESFDHLRTAAALAAEEAAARLTPAVESARESARESMKEARETMGPRLERARERAMEATAPRIERAREAASHAWDTRVRSAADSATEMSRRARRKAEKAARKAARRTQEFADSLQTEQARKPRRWRWMLGALGAGAAIGVVSALISRRRAADWEEYDTETAAGGSPSAVPSGGTRYAAGTPSGAVTGTDDTTMTPAGKWSDSSATDTGSATTEHSSPGVSNETPTGGARGKLGDVAETAKRKTSEAVEVAREKASTAKKRLADVRKNDPTVPPAPVREANAAGETATTSRNDGTSGTGPRH